MACIMNSAIMVAVVILVAGILTAKRTGAQIGVCNGMLGSNLPPAGEVVGLCKQNRIERMRIYAPHQPTLDALRGSGIGLILDVGDALQGIASSTAEAQGWVQRNVLAYWPDVKIRYIAAGNELVPTAEAQFILPAMRNIYAAISPASLQNDIKVSTAVHSAVLSADSFPPSAGRFSDESQGYMRPIVQFLASTGAPLLANIYPYFSYTGNRKDIPLPYALFTSPSPQVYDGPYSYQNLFDASLDTMYAALEKDGGRRVVIVVSESGWPSAGDPAATMENAQTYNQNLIRHVQRGTPRRPGRPVETYIFALFNEDRKNGLETERNFGLFYPNKKHVYPINFNN